MEKLTTSDALFIIVIARNCGVLRLVLLLYDACNLFSPFALSCPFVPSYSRSLSHFLPFLTARENSHQRLAALLSSNLSFFARTFPSRISPPPEQSDFFLFVAAAVAAAFQSIWEKEREKEKESAIYQSRLFDYTHAIVYDSARESNRNSLLFALPYCSHFRIAVSPTRLQIAVVVADVK